ACIRSSIFLTRLVKGSLVWRTKRRATRSLGLQTGQSRLPAQGPVSHWGKKPVRSLRAPTGGPDWSGRSAWTRPASTRKAQAAPANTHRDMDDSSIRPGELLYSYQRKPDGRDDRIFGFFLDGTPSLTRRVSVEPCWQSARRSPLPSRARREGHRGRRAGLARACKDFHSSRRGRLPSRQPLQARQCRLGILRQMHARRAVGPGLERGTRVGVIDELEDLEAALAAQFV